MPDAPTIALVKYTIGELQVQWDPATYTDFVVNLKDSGGIDLNQPATGTSAIIEITLDSTDTYTVTVIAMQNGQQGPSSQPRTVIAAPPVYSQLKYTLIGGIGNLDMKWGAVSQADAYITTVEATDGSYMTNIPSVDPNCQLGKILDPTVNYEATTIGVSADGVVQGPPDESLTAIVAQAAFTLLQYSLTDAVGSLTVQWGAVRNADHYSTRVKASDGSFDQQYPSTTPYVEIPVTLDSTKTYTVTVATTADNGVIIGPVSQVLSPLLKAPVVSQVQYTLDTGLGVLTTTWSALQNVPIYVTTIQSEDGSIKRNIPSVAPSSRLQETLPPDKLYDLTVVGASADGVVVGPASSLLHPIIATASLTLIEYDLSAGNGSLTTQWDAVISADLYVTTIQATDGSYSRNIPTTDPSSVLSATLDDTRTYTVVVSGMNSGGIVLGPPSILYTAIVAGIADPMLNCSATQLIAHWTIPPKLAGLTFEAGLFKAGISIDTRSTTTNTQAFDFGLTPATVYTSRIRATNGIVKGPWSLFTPGPYSTSLVYTFDALARLTAVTWDSAMRQGYEFDNSGNLTTISIASVPA